MPSRKLVLSVLCAVGVGVAIAADYGRYLCKRCEVPMAPEDVRNFVGTYANSVAGRWKIGDTLSICNGTECVLYLTPNAGIVWSPQTKYKDPQEGYKLEGDKLADGGGGSGGEGGLGSEGNGTGGGGGSMIGPVAGGAGSTGGGGAVIVRPVRIVPF